MNIYEKLQKCKVELQGSRLKKSGKNSYAGYDYFELDDFMPTINKLFLEHKLFGQVSFNSELATLTITDAEKPESTLSYTSPMADASLKGCHAIQNLGAVQTYQRRYLYMTALDITEKDALDSTYNIEVKTEKAETKTEKREGKVLNKPTKQHLLALSTMAQEKNISLKKKGQEWTGKSSSAEWTMEDYLKVKKELEGVKVDE